MIDYYADLTKLGSIPYILPLLFITMWLFVTKHKKIAFYSIGFLICFYLLDRILFAFISYINSNGVGGGLYIENLHINLLPIYLLKIIFFVLLLFLFWVTIRYFQKYKLEEKNVKIFTIITTMIFIYIVLYLVFQHTGFELFRNRFLASLKQFDNTNLRIYGWTIIFSAIFTASRAAGGWSVFLAFDGGSEWFKTWLLHFCLSSVFFITILKIFI